MISILSAALLATSLGASARETVVDASFEVRVPAGWTLDRRDGAAVLTGPAADGVASLISVRFVKPGHALYGTAEAYMKRMTRPADIPMPGWKDGPVTTVTSGGRKALRLVRDTSEFSAPHSMQTKEIPLREEHLAIPAAHGFYLLVYTAPRSIDKAQRAVFRALASKGFKPKL